MIGYLESSGHVLSKLYKANQSLDKLMTYFEVKVHIAIYSVIGKILPILSKFGMHDPWVNSFHKCTK